MSTEMACDGCGKLAKIRGYHMAPEGWLYLPAFDSDPASLEEGCDFVIMLACSVECAGKLWRPGPGPQLDQVRADRRLELERLETQKDPLAREWGKNAAEILASNRRQVQLTRQAYLRTRAIEVAARTLLNELEKSKIATLTGAVLREALKPSMGDN